MSPAMVTREPPTAPDIYGDYAGFVTRLIALTVDLLILSASSTIILATGQFLGQVLHVGQLTQQLIGVICAGTNTVIFVAYFIAFWVLVGQTPGQRLMGVHVVAVDGGPVTLSMGVRRFIGCWLALPFFWGYLIVLVDDRRRAFQDRFAGTVVVYVGGQRP